MLTQKEIIQFHKNSFVRRNSKILNKIPYSIISYTWKFERNFSKVFEIFDKDDTEIYIKNKMAEKLLENILVYYKDEAPTLEQIQNFSEEKSNLIIQEYQKLNEDIIEYLRGYEEQPLADEEIEEYIFTDQIIRTGSLSLNEEVSPITFEYSALNLKNNQRIGEELKNIFKKEKVNSKITADFLKEEIYTINTINKINSIPVDKDSIDQFSSILIRFIMDRAEKVKKQIRETLSNPEKISDSLKN